MCIFIKARPNNNSTEGLMALLGKLKVEGKCMNCGNPLGNSSIAKGGNEFCSPACLKTYESKHKTKADNVCEFC